MKDRTSGIILAADVETPRELHQLAYAARDIPEITAIKIGCIFGLRHTVRAAVHAVSDTSDLHVIYDHQKAGTDVPFMGAPFADVCLSAGVSGAIIFPQAGPATLHAFVTAFIERQITPIVGLTMTHKSYLSSDGGWIEDNAPNSIRHLAGQLGVTHFVLPGNKPDYTKRHAKVLADAGVKATIMMPGIGTQGGLLSEALEAAKPHKRRGIIGSAIYKDKNPKEAMLRFVGEMNAS